MYLRTATRVLGASVVCAALAFVVTKWTLPVAPTDVTHASDATGGAEDAAAAASYREHLGASEPGVDGGLASVVKHRAAIQTLRDALVHANAPLRGSTLDVALFGNLESYIEPCACSSNAATGGLAVIARVLEWWRAFSGSTAIAIDVGDSLVPRAALSSDVAALYRMKATVIAECYRDTGVAAFCPSPADLRIFRDVSDLTAWATTAAAKIVVTNLAPGDTGPLQPVFRVADDLGTNLLVASLLDPADLTNGLPPGLQFRSLDATVAWLANEAQTAANVLVVVHSDQPRHILQLLPDSLVQRTIIVVPSPLTAQCRRDLPLINTAVTQGRVLELASRGQAVVFCQFLAPRTGTPALSASTTPSVVLLDYALHSGRTLGYTRLLSAVGTADSVSLFGAQRVPLDKKIGDWLGHDMRIVAKIRTYETRLFAELLHRDTIAPTEVPESVMSLDPAACNKCHEEAVARFGHDPHSGSYDRLLQNTVRPADFSCLRCHLVGFKSATVDAAPLQRRGPWSMRTVTKGVTCVSCHSDVTSAHIMAREQRVSRSVAALSCVGCHDSVNSPAFKFDEYVRHLECCASDAHTSERRSER